MKTYDLAVVGAGLAGTMAAVAAVEAGLDTVVLEKGHGPGDRRNLVNGWLGRALYTMTRLDVGNICLEPRSVAAFNTVFELCRDANGGKLERHLGGSHILSEDLPLQALARLYYSADAECGRELAQRLHKRLLVPGKTDLLFGAEVERAEWDGSRFLLHTRRGRLAAARCMVATGGHSAEWIRLLCASVGIEPAAAHARLGVRVEVPERLLRTFLRVAGDLCLSNGDVVMDDMRVGSMVGDREDEGLLSAFAHTLSGHRAERISFMVSLDFGTDLSELARIVRIVNILSNDKVKRERAADFVDGHSALKHVEQFDPVRAALRDLDRMVPSLLGYATVYIPEMRIGGVLPVDEKMRTAFSGLYGAGECVSRVDGLLDAMVSALASAQSVMEDRNG